MGNSLYQQYNNTGFLQLMTTATGAVLEQVLGTEGPTIQLAYAPMNTGAFTLQASETTVAIFFGITLIMFANLGNSINSSLVPEENEQKVQWLLRLNGMKPLVPFMQDTILYLLTSGVGVFMTVLVGKFAVMPNVGFGV